MRVKDITLQTGVTRQTVRRWIKLGQLKATSDPVGYLIDECDWEEFKNKQSEIGEISKFVAFSLLRPKNK